MYCNGHLVGRGQTMFCECISRECVDICKWTFVGVGQTMLVNIWRTGHCFFLQASSEMTRRITMVVFSIITMTMVLFLLMFWLHLKCVTSWLSTQYWILGFVKIHFYAIEYTMLLCDVFDIEMKSNIVWSHRALKINQKFCHQISHFMTKYHWCIISYDQILLMVLLPKDVRNERMLWCPFCSITSIVSDKITQMMFFFAFYSILLPARFHDRCHDSWHDINCSENKWFHQILVQN